MCHVKGRNKMWSSIAILLVALCGIVHGQAGARAGKTATGISYDVQGSGPVVVLLSGANLDRRMWVRETAWLARDHTVVRYDLRAHGQSDTATAPFTNEQEDQEVRRNIFFSERRERRRHDRRPGRRAPAESDLTEGV